MSSAVRSTSVDGPDTSHAGLLTEIMSHTVDEDYRAAAARREDRPTPRGPSGRVTGAVVIVLFGVMIGISALQTQEQQPIAAAERDQLVAQIHERQDRLDALHRQLADLETAVSDMQQSASESRTLERQTDASITEVAGVSGAGEVSGPGIQITTDDAPDSVGSAEGGVIRDTDLQALVNALWGAGAEAVAINGHRLTSLSAIRFAGQAITVDYRSLTPPYVVDAVGNPDTLPAQLLEMPGGQAWLGLKENYGIRFDTLSVSSLVLPADSDIAVRHAEPVGPR
ncbi:MAG: DUF881 domain-containing protein [Nocardioidaceae bacterium]